MNAVTTAVSLVACEFQAEKSTLASAPCKLILTRFQKNCSVLPSCRLFLRYELVHPIAESTFAFQADFEVVFLVKNPEDCTPGKAIASTLPQFCRLVATLGEDSMIDFTPPSPLVIWKSYLAELDEEERLSHASLGLEDIDSCQ